MNSVYFKEEQRFPIWLKLIVSLSSFFIILSIIMTATDENEKWVALAIVGIILPVVNFVFWSFKLETKIQDDVIELNAQPFFGKQRYGFSDLSDLRIHSTKSWKTFPGGWGYRRDLKGNVYYNASGFKGLWVEKKKGKNVYISSKKIEALERIVDYWNKKYGSTKA